MLKKMRKDPTILKVPFAMLYGFFHCYLVSFTLHHLFNNLPHKFLCIPFIYILRKQVAPNF